MDREDGIGDVLKELASNGCLPALLIVLFILFGMIVAWRG